MGKVMFLMHGTVQFSKLINSGCLMNLWKHSIVKLIQETNIKT